MRVFCLALLVLLSAATSYGANAYTAGNELQEWFVNSERGSESNKALFAGLSSGYVNGVVDVANTFFFCTDANTTRGQFIDIVRKYLANNPEKRHLSANSIVVEAMAKAFPCRD
jgi:hypothetical protein